MINVFLLKCIFVAIFLYYIYNKHVKNKGNLPPGPRGLPIIGNLHQIVKQAPLTFSKWAYEYGSLYTIRMGGSTPALVVSDPHLIRKLFGKMAATGVYPSELWDTLFSGRNGVVNTEGTVWQEQRQFCIKALRNFGFGKGSQTEPLILQEVEDLVDYIRKEMKAHGKVGHLSAILKQTTGNTLWAMVTGETMKTNISHLLEEWLKATQIATNSGLAFFAWLKYVMPEMSGYTAYSKACKNIQDFVWKYFKEHQNAKEMGLAHEHHDLITAYIDQVEGTKNPQSSFFGEKGMAHGFHTVVGLLMAGSETTSSTLHWMIYYLATYPHVQKKVHKEIEKVIGYRDPGLGDRSNMPYTDAVIQEALRMSCIAPFGQMHCLTENMEFEGYKLPKGLLLIANIYHAHHDTGIWSDPKNFRPERFLKKDDEINNGYVDLRECVVSFQPGKRICLGETMARDVIFLFLIKLVKTFEFSTVKGKEVSKYLEPKVGFHMLPQEDLGITASARDM